MINKAIIKAIKNEELGLSLTELVTTTKFSRGQIRIAVSFLLGANKIKERKFGVMKLYYLSEGKE